jgi:integrase/recombinase XerD
MELRRIMPIEEWPEVDRDLWERLSGEQDFFSDDIARPAHWRAPTRHKAVKLYGRWLTFIAETGRLMPGEHPCDRVTPEAVRAYVEMLEAQVSSYTCWSYVVVVHQMALAFEPGRDWAWLYRITAKLAARRVPTRQKLSRMRPAHEIASWAQQELDRLLVDPPRRTCDAKAYRDVLMVALLIDCPVRIRNFTMVRIGHHLVRIGAGWTLRFAPHEVKTNRYLDMEIGEHLYPHLEAWLDDIRPLMLTGHQTDCLWVGITGQPLLARGTHKVICETTQRAFGKPINPHLFRDIAATSVADEDPAHVGIAGSLLGHMNPKTVENHYIHADQIRAGKRHREAISALRRDLQQEKA